MKFFLAKIDLTKKKAEKKEIPKSMVKEWVGGRGLGAAFLKEDVRDPFDPKSSLFITTGAVTGTMFPSSSRIEVTAISPLTGFYLGSNAGGYFGLRLRSQGYYGIQITGKSKKPVYVDIDNGKMEIKDARDFWGMTTGELIKQLGENEKKSLACIGPGGENVVKFACLQFDWRSAGRGGAGAIFGEKKLKAIVVGTGKKIEVFDEKVMREISLRLYKNKNLRTSGLSSCGTSNVLEYSNKIRTLPVDNYRKNHTKNAKKINAFAVQKVTERDWGCWSCVVKCERITKSKKYNVEARGPEYETLYALGSDCENYDMDVIIKANNLCDNYSLDTISCGATIAWFRECCEKGLVKEKWSGNEMIIDLIEKIAYRKGIGDLLAEGSFLASKKIPGSEKFLAGAKGLEAPAWDPRPSWATALCYATSPNGADHRKGRPVEEDLKSLRPMSTVGKAAIAIKAQDEKAVNDSTGVCDFVIKHFDPQDIVDGINAAIGIGITQKDLKELGGKIINIEREINLKRGLKKEDDTLSERLLNYPIKVYVKTALIGKENLEKMKKEYYELRGWD